jgi:hypothetical protein
MAYFKKPAWKTAALYRKQTRSIRNKKPQAQITGPFYLSAVTQTRKGQELQTPGKILIKLSDRTGKYIQWVNPVQAQTLLNEYPNDVFWLTLD